jgi:osmotically-inducible protein OsmY
MGAQSQSGSSATGGVSGQATSQSSVPAGQEAQSQSSVGQQAGSAGQSTTSGQSSMGAQSQSGSMGAGASSDDQLQQQIQTALKNDPTLANDNINVTLAADSITLTGEVASGKEKKSAQRIAESYAGNRKVKNEITVSGKGAGASPNPSYPNQKPPQN